MLGLCEKFGCPPSVLNEEDSDIMRLVAIVNMGNPPKETPDVEEEEFDG